MSTRTSGLLGVAALSLAICASGASAADDITIGAILPLTGPNAVIGIEEQQGVQFALDAINAKDGIRGHKVKVIFDDNQGKPEQAVLSFNKQIDLYGVPVIITAFSGPTLAIAPLATRKRVLVVNPAAQSDKLGDASPYLVNTMPLVRNEADRLAKFVRDTLQKKTAAVIYENSAAGIDGRNDFKAAFLRYGGEILTDEPVQPGDTNFRPILLKTAAAKPDVVFVNLLQGYAQFTDQTAQQSGFPPVIGTTFMTPAMRLPAAEGWYYTAIRGHMPDALEQTFAAAYGGKRPSVYSREYFNGMNLIATIAESLLGQDKPLTGENFRTELFRLKTFEGVATIVFDGNTASRDIDILQVKDGSSVLVTAGAAK